MIGYPLSPWIMWTIGIGILTSKVEKKAIITIWCFFFGTILIVFNTF